VELQLLLQRGDWRNFWLGKQGPCLHVIWLLWLSSLNHGTRFFFNQSLRWFICNVASLKSRWSICCCVSNLQRNSWQAMQRLQCIFSMFGAEHEPPVQLHRTVQSITQEFLWWCVTASTATSSLWEMDGEWRGNTFPLGSSSLLCCGYYLPTNNYPVPLTFVLTVPTY